MEIGDRVIVIATRFRGQNGAVGRVTDILKGDHWNRRDLTHSVRLGAGSHPCSIGRGVLSYGEVDLQVVNLPEPVNADF